MIALNAGFDPERPIICCEESAKLLPHTISLIHKLLHLLVWLADDVWLMSRIMNGKIIFTSHRILKLVTQSKPEFKTRINKDLIVLLCLTDLDGI